MKKKLEMTLKRVALFLRVVNSWKTEGGGERERERAIAYKCVCERERYTICVYEQVTLK